MTEAKFNFPPLKPLPDEAFGKDDHDSIIALAPPAVYIGDALVITRVNKALRQLIAESEARVGRKLHDASFVFTRDPAVIRSTRADDCMMCLAAEDQVLSKMRDNPDTEFVVGWLRWIPTA